MKKQSNVIDMKKDQVQYMGKWFNKKTFRTFVYNHTGAQKLAENYEQYEDLITSGLWFDTKQAASTLKRKQKDDADS